MTAADIAISCGGAHRCGEWWRCVCPVHGSRTGRSATLALRDGDRGLIAICHAGSDREDILDDLRRRGLISARNRSSSAFRAPRLSAPIGPTTRGGAKSPGDSIGWASRIWAHSFNARQTPVVAYLAARGIDIEPPPCLRWSPLLRRLDGTSGPGMVALVQHVERGIVGIHWTWFDRDAPENWRRRDRASLGPIGGGGVLLAPATDTLLIGEGIESCLSAMQATGLAACAALSAGGIESLLLPPTVRHVIILADNDMNLRGQRAAWIAAQRWTSEGRSVRIAMPPQPDTDFNDLLIENAGSLGGEFRHA